jgi:hypothetical protein
MIVVVYLPLVKVEKSTKMDLIDIKSYYTILAIMKGQQFHNYIPFFLMTRKG